MNQQQQKMKKSKQLPGTQGLVCFIIAVDLGRKATNKQTNKDLMCGLSVAYSNYHSLIAFVCMQCKLYIYQANVLIICKTLNNILIARINILMN